VNGYGPTESTTFACCCRIPSPLPESLRSIPIGRPIENTQVAILDAELRPVRAGEDGELCIAGDGLALGYHRLPDLTRERFVEAPDAPGGRFYRTGDRVRLLASGEIEFLGRLDTQVKLDGHRIELGEIESQLRGHATLRDAAVQVHQDAAGARRLVAYVLPRDCAAVPRFGELRTYLAERLPPYMVPHLFVALEELPLTPNGKLDRDALPEPERRRPELEHPFVPPRTELERFIAGVWRELLGVDRVGTRDRFFELGGSSLLALRFTRAVGAELDVPIRIADFFDAPTVTDVARVLLEKYGEKLSARFGLQEAAAVEIEAAPQLRAEGRRRRRDARREGRFDE
jgi:aspartate racemase